MNHDNKGLSSLYVEISWFVTVLCSGVVGAFYLFLMRISLNLNNIIIFPLLAPTDYFSFDFPSEIS